MDEVHEVLAEKDRKRLYRLLSRMLGKNFKLAVVEVQLPKQRKAVTQWLEAQLPQAAFFEVDLSNLSRENLWAALTEHLSWRSVPKNGVLILHGLENIMGDNLERPEVFQQLNVQRDLFVRDLPVPWVFFIHPESRAELYRVAPDFCDFAAVWLEAFAPKTRNDRLRALEQLEYYNEVLPDLTDYLTHPLLIEAWEAFIQWKYVHARDLLAQFDLNDHPDNEKEQRHLLGIIDLQTQGHMDKAQELLEEMMVNHPSFEGPVTIDGKIHWQGIVEALCEQRDSEIFANIIESPESEKGVNRNAFISEFKQAHVFFMRRDYGNALNAFKALQEKLKSIDTAIFPDYDFEYARILYFIGLTHLLMQETNCALPYLYESEIRFADMAESTNLNASYFAAGATMALGECFRSLGRFDESEMAYKKSLVGFERMGSEREPALIKLKLGFLYSDHKLYRKAITSLMDAKDAFENLKNLELLLSTLSVIGLVFERTGQFDKADKAYQAILSNKAATKDSHTMVTTLDNLAKLYVKKERMEEALSYSQRAVDYFELEGVNSPIEKGLAIKNMGLILVQTGRIDEARQAYADALALVNASGRDEESWVIYKALSDLEIQDGREVEAQEAWKMAVDLYLAYRREGAENHTWAGRLFARFRDHYSAGQPDTIREALTAIQNAGDHSESHKNLAAILLEILNGSRDPKLADDQNLAVDDAAEILLLLNDLKARDKTDE